MNNQAFSAELLRRLDRAEGLLFRACNYRARKARDDENYARSKSDLRRTFWLWGLCGLIAAAAAISAGRDGLALLALAIAAAMIYSSHAVRSYDAQVQDRLRAERTDLLGQWLALGLTPQLFSSTLEKLTPAAGWVDALDSEDLVLTSDVANAQRQRIEQQLRQHVERSLQRVAGSMSS
jgi:hypothetical protein